MYSVHTHTASVVIADYIIINAHFSWTCRVAIKPVVFAGLSHVCDCGPGHGGRWPRVEPRSGVEGFQVSSLLSFFLVYKPILVHALSLTKLLKNYIIILVKLYKNFYPLTKVKNSFALFEGLKMSYFMYLFQIFSLANVL